jgi:enamine deaminase RidA (YjgF/YER057c/UK114 family)
MPVELVSAGPPPRGPYAAGTLATGTRTLTISGALPEGMENEIIGGDDPELQARQCLENIDAVLTAAGATRADVVRIGVYLTDMADRPGVQRARIAYFGDHQPAATLVQITSLVPPDAKVEIEATAIF